MRHANSQAAASGAQQPYLHATELRLKRRHAPAEERQDAVRERVEVGRAADASDRDCSNFWAFAPDAQGSAEAGQTLGRSWAQGLRG